MLQLEGEVTSSQVLLAISARYSSVIASIHRGCSDALEKEVGSTLAIKDIRGKKVLDLTIPNLARVCIR